MLLSLLNRRRSAVVATLVLITTLLSAAEAQGVTVSPGVMGTFQQDGNQVVDDNPLTSDDDGQIDWASYAGSLAPFLDDTADTGFQGSSKELKPSGWTCNTGGAEPAKGNLLRSYLNVRAAAGLIDLAWVRQNLQSSGDVEIDFELNQAAPPAGDCQIARTAGDILIAYRFPGGTAAPDISAFKWSPHATPTAQEDGEWVDLGLTAGDAKGAVNSVTPLVDDLMTAAVDPIGLESFGEATIRLAALFETGSRRPPPCRSFGYLNIRSKSSRENDRAALQDRMPTQDVDLYSCGGIVLKKVDDHVPPRPISGVGFSLFATTQSLQALDTCTTGDDGRCSFSNVEPGQYWIRETSPPADHTYSADPIGPVTVTALALTDLTGDPVVNARETGFVSVTKLLQGSNEETLTPPDLAFLDGATFVIYRDADQSGTFDSGEEAKLWPDESATATCTVAGGTGGCTMGPLPTGGYRLTETAAPTGTNLTAADVDITVTAGSVEEPLEVSMTNSVDDPQLTLVKDGPAAAYVGDTITYTFTVSTTGPPLYDVGIAELTAGRCDADPILAPSLSTGSEDGLLDAGDSWTFTCSHLVKASDLGQLDAQGRLLNEAESSAADAFGRPVTSEPDDHAVLIVQPSIRVTKTVNGAESDSVAPGDPLVYVVTVTNTGKVPLTITSLTDSLHDPLPPTCAALIGTSLAAGASTSCTYTDEASTAATNVVVVQGLDQVLADAKHTVRSTDSTAVTVDEVLGEVILNDDPELPRTDAELPRTGGSPDLAAQGLILAVGMAARRLRRRIAAVD
jgi:uncharacterized repeat protein (TIGR01451 family)